VDAVDTRLLGSARERNHPGHDDEFRPRAGIWKLRITAMHTKTKEYRDVPLHDHLIEQGLIEYMKSRGARPLFYDPARSRGGSDGNPHYKKVGERMAEWVGTIVPDVKAGKVQSNHGWRHRFSSLAREVGMHVDVQNIIQGHVGERTAESYGDAWLTTAYREIMNFPDTKYSCPYAARASSTKAAMTASCWM
jgi:integrase